MAGDSGFDAAAMAALQQVTASVCWQRDTPAARCQAANLRAAAAAEDEEEEEEGSEAGAQTGSSRFTGLPCSYPLSRYPLNASCICPQYLQMSAVNKACDSASLCKRKFLASLCARFAWSPAEPERLQVVLEG